MDNYKKRKGGAEKIRDRKRQALHADAAKCVKITQMFAGGGASSSATAATAGDDGGGGRQVDEGKGRQEERPAAAGGPSGGESELQVRSVELQSIWVRYELSVDVVG